MISSFHVLALSLDFPRPQLMLHIAASDEAPVFTGSHPVRVLNSWREQPRG